MSMTVAIIIMIIMIMTRHPCTWCATLLQCNLEGDGVHFCAGELYLTLWKAEVNELMKIIIQYTPTYATSDTQK